ncbi:hypothetical protein [Streptomyces sp. MBT53]|uniref:hypothetical protein n=1 Tax=Streptomyces sp. MBT53 TaxID=1488384 RepID=UPI0027D9EEB2|nr:hypothetical protein [Streptomyces sp. MBT53]
MVTGVGDAVDEDEEVEEVEEDEEDEEVGVGDGLAKAMPGAASTVTAQTTVMAVVIRARLPAPIPLPPHHVSD